MSRPHPRNVVRTVCALAALAAVAPGAPASASGASAPPRLYSAVVQDGGAFVRVFKVRPRTVSLTCADGGTLEALTWRRWTRNSASGSGWTHPCDGAVQAVTLFVSRPIEGYFTRMSVRYDGGAPNRLGLGRVGGRLFWLGLRALPGSGPDSGPWPR